MLIRRHCAAHPSREAAARCRACHRWLCELCTVEVAGHAYCGWRCRLRDVVARPFGRVRALLARPVPAWAWTAAVATAALALLVVLAIGAARLHALRPKLAASAPPPATPSLSGRLVRHDAGWVVEAKGPPGLALLVVVNADPAAVLTLDAEGASLSLPATGETAPRVRLVPLPQGGLTLRVTSPPQRPSQEPLPAMTPTPASRTIARATRPPPTVQATSERRVRPAKRSAAPPVLHLVPGAGRRLALTFDGASSANGTTDLLELLERLDLRVTLFLTGEFIERHPITVRRALRAGHEIGNHTYDHPHLTTYAQNRRHDLLPKMTEAVFKDELMRTEAAFERTTGRSMAPLWRAPYGEENTTLRRWALELGYLHVRWSSLSGATLDAHDWVDDEHSSLYQDSERMVERLLSFPRLEGGIVLMHLASNRQQPPWSALPDFVGALRDRRIEIVSVSRLLEASPTWRGWLDRARRAARTRPASGR